MKNNKKTILLYTSTTLVIALMSLTGCSDNNLSGNSLNPASVGPSQVKSTLSGEPDVSNMQFILSPTSVSSAGNGTNIQTTLTAENEDYLIVNSSLSQPNSQTTVVTASADGQNSTPLEYIIDINNAAARHMVTNTIYNGSNTINYTVQDQQKTASLNQQQEQLLSTTQQQFNTAQTVYNNMPSAIGGSNPLMSKSDQQIKQMLQAKGFTVTILGNNKFQLTKTEGDITTSQIFNAETFSADDYEINYQGQEAYSTYFVNGTIHTVQTINE